MSPEFAEASGVLPTFAVDHRKTIKRLKRVQASESRCRGHLAAILIIQDSLFRAADQQPGKTKRSQTAKLFRDAGPLKANASSEILDRPFDFDSEGARVNLALTP